MLQNLTGWHALIILAIVLIIFGAAKLPALARSVGQSVRILKDEAADSATEPAATADGRFATNDAVPASPLTTAPAAASEPTTLAVPLSSPRAS
ncbi:twin-arginine translocase TatA/TatE family subunit [Microbacterium sp. NPDC077663]|uniref:twin-arginine translocase TatA/TatE family subunit n=1 Tax=Microbacterium sp. NPDC077663 TaxID=3364189 RepID=UPI0037C66260